MSIKLNMNMKIYSRIRGDIKQVKLPKKPKKEKKKMQVMPCLTDSRIFRLFLLINEQKIKSKISEILNCR